MASINEYSSPVQNTLEGYIPLPLDFLLKAGQAIQQRGDQAQQQNDQIQTGLASAEALAPAHRDYINKLSSDFRTQQGALLDKYQGNTSDPQYINEARRLNMQFAADPRLQVIKQANDNIKRKQAIGLELKSKGIKTIDSNANFTGKDDQGNLLSDPGSYRATDFDKQIDMSFKDKEGAIEQIGHQLTNRGNLQKVKNHYLDALANNSDPAIADGLAYYKQQGMSDLEARHAILGHIGAGMGYAHDLKDHFYEMSPYQQAELKLKQEEIDAKTSKNNPNINPPFHLLDFSKPIVPTGSNSQDEKQETPNSSIFNQIEKVKQGLTKEGNLNAGERQVEDTPENRKAFGKNATPIMNVSGGSGMGYGTYSSNALLVKDKYNPDEVKLLQTARQLTGYRAGEGKASEVLQKYSDLIKSFDSANFKTTSTNNAKLNSVMADVARRQINTGEVYKLVNGKTTKVTDPKELTELQTASGSIDSARDNEIKNIQIAGISPKTLGNLNGFTQFSNKGTSYYTPIPDQMQQKFAGSKSVENYIQDFDPKKLSPVDITTSEGKVKAFIDPDHKPIDYVYQGMRGRLIPFKSTQGDKLGGGGLFQYIDPKTGKVAVAPIPLSELEREEKTSLFTEMVNDNKIKGD